MRAHRKTWLAAAAAALFLAGSSNALANTAGSPSGAGAQARGPYTTKDQDNLWNLGSQRMAADYSLQQWMVATLRRNPEAFVQGNIHRLRKQVPLQLPTAEEVKAENQQAAEALLVRHEAGVLSNEAFAALAPLAGVSGQAAAPAQAPVASPAPPAPPAAASAPAVPAVTAVTSPAPSPQSASSAAPSSPAVAVAPAASAPQAAAPGASVAVSADTSKAAATSGSLWRWWPLGLALVMGAGSIALLRRARHEGRPFSETVSTFFQETIQRAQRSKPKVVTISSAGADMARSVERLGATGTMVQAEHSPSNGRTETGGTAGEGGQDPQSREAVQRTHEANAAGLRQESGLRLLVAKSQLELGRKDSAIVLLRGLVRDTADSAERRAAQALLAQLGVT